jgi:hypothetical protein
MSAVARLALALALLCAAAPAGAQHEGHGAAQSAAAAAIPRTPRPADAKLYIISPKNGETVTSPVTIRFGLTGMGVAPAGVASPNTGHHHLLIDAPLPDFGLPIPKDEKHVHFGGGQTEVTVPMQPGEHRIRLILGDQIHVPHDPPLYSDEITFTVK